jgi:ubiquinone/menaquinone biosynthesis C-methylase UbiE
MESYNIDEVRNCYNIVAQEYADIFTNELDGKPFDRDFLRRFRIHFSNNNKIIDFGTGCGHIANYLYKLGLTDIIGTDISDKILEIARTKYPYIKFENRNMFDTKLENNSVDGIVCFYGIVHFTYKEIELTIKEWKRILKPGGKAIFSFHLGDDDSIRVENFLNKENANATWNNFKMEKIIEILNLHDIKYNEAIIRYPYINKEHPSKRGYIRFTKRKNQTNEYNGFVI